MDKHSKEIRSYNMSMIKSSGTKPEEAVKNICFQKDSGIVKMLKCYRENQILFCPNIKQ